MVEDKIRFVEKGNKIVVKRTVPDRELSYKDVVETLAAVDNKKAEFEKNIVEMRDDIEKAQENIKNFEEAIKTNKERRKDLAKFEEKANMYQEKLLFEKISQLKDKVAEDIKTKYNYDQALTAEQNEAQLFAQYQKTIATHEDIVSTVAVSIIRQVLYKTDKLESPFKGCFSDKK